MKRFIALFAVLSLLLVLGGFVGASPAFACHKTAHNCQGGGGQPPSCTDGKNDPQNKHCYPPKQKPPKNTGASFPFPAQGPDQGGLTVGMATLLAIGALGTLLLIRRRWVFKTDKP